ncbi:MAG: flagellar basal body rod C-terminal domain-containing protein, partial [Myxococcota bacterium]
NTAHSAGFGLDGANGRSLFEVGATAPGAAGRFAVSADVSGQPDRLAAASAATDIPGGNDAALVLTGLAEANLAGGSTPTGTFAALVGSAGASLRAAADGADAASAALDQVRALRDNVSGVSTDEEMINLMELQRGYQATLRVIQTADEMLEGIINLKR